MTDTYTAIGCDADPLLTVYIDRMRRAHARIVGRRARGRADVRSTVRPFEYLTMTLPRTYRLIARETHRALSQSAALIGRTEDPDRLGAAASCAASAAARARYLAAHAVGIDRAAFLRACGLPADARRYDQEPAR